MNHVSAAIREDFEAVNRLVVAKLHSDVGLVENIGHYIIEGGGKRLRPLITLLCARALGYAGTRHIELATVIEFLHTATLLHDDVVDVSALRRGRATANANWGNAPSVLVGDFIYSRAFQLLVAIGDIEILRLLSDTTNEIAEGEVEQLSRAGDPQTTAAQYMQVIRKKTAVLFAAAAQGAALLAALCEATYLALRTFGLNLGIAFQLIDDVLDYSGDPELMGKNVGDDLAEGKPTLPLIYAMANSPEDDAQHIRQAILSRDKSAIQQVLGAVQRCGALDFARSVAIEHRKLAIAALSCIPENEFRHNLLTITDLAVDRRA